MLKLRGEISEAFKQICLQLNATPRRKHMLTFFQIIPSPDLFQNHNEILWAAMSPGQ